MLTSVRATVMRGGTSKGLYFHAQDLPSEEGERNKLLLAIMGSPDIRQIDGMGGAHPLTSKVAIISKSSRSDADVDYLFLQVVVDKAEVKDNQNCGNILSGVGPWAIENHLVEAQSGVTRVRIYMVNTGAITEATVQTPEKQVTYQGLAKIDGVPGTAAPISLTFLDIAGASCGALLPTNNVKDHFEGVDVTCIDNGMPVVIVRAKDLGVTGYESPEELERNIRLKKHLEAIRLQAGEAMNLGNVSEKTVPKMTLISSARQQGLVNTRTFIPHRVHESIGVLGAVSVATAVILPGSVGESLVEQTLSEGRHDNLYNVEHPTGYFTVNLCLSSGSNGVHVHHAALLRTARKLMMGDVFPARYY